MSGNALEQLGSKVASAVGSMPALMVPEEVASVPDVLETRDDGEGEREPKEGRHEPGAGVGQLGEEEFLLTEGL